MPATTIVDSLNSIKPIISRAPLQQPNTSASAARVELGSCEENSSTDGRTRIHPLNHDTGRMGLGRISWRSRSQPPRSESLPTSYAIPTFLSTESNQQIASLSDSAVAARTNVSAYASASTLATTQSQSRLPSAVTPRPSSSSSSSGSFIRPRTAFSHRLCRPGIGRKYEPASCASTSGAGSSDSNSSLIGRYRTIANGSIRCSGGTAATATITAKCETSLPQLLRFSPLHVDVSNNNCSPLERATISHQLPLSMAEELNDSDEFPNLPIRRGASGQDDVPSTRVASSIDTDSSASSLTTETESQCAVVDNTTAAVMSSHEQTNSETAEPITFASITQSLPPESERATVPTRAAPLVALRFPSLGNTVAGRVTPTSSDNTVS